MSPAQDEASRWNRALRCFRFAYAFGGHAHDFDTLSAQIRFPRGEAGVRELCMRLGVMLVDARDGDAGALRVAGHPQWLQPGLTTVLGRPAYVSLGEGRATIDATHDLWTVGARDFAHALALERELPARGVALVERPSLEVLERLIEAMDAAGTLAHGAVPSREVRATLAPALADDEAWSEASATVSMLCAVAVRGERATPVARGGRAASVARALPGLSARAVERVIAGALSAR